VRPRRIVFAARNDNLLRLTRRHGESYHEEE
jgi:hypothetical protein